MEIDAKHDQTDLSQVGHRGPVVIQKGRGQD